MRWLDDLLQGDFGKQVLDVQQFHAERRQQHIAAIIRRAADFLGDKVVPDEEPDHDWVGRFFHNVQNEA